MLKCATISILTTFSLVYGLVVSPAVVQAAGPEPVSGVVGPWTVYNVAQETDDWSLESFKVDRDLVVWTSLSADGGERRLSVFDGRQTTVLATMAAADWDDASWFYDPVDGNYDVADGLVVWVQHDGSDREVWSWDGQVIRKVSDNSYDDRHPVTSRGSVAWTSAPGESYNLMVRNTAGELRMLSTWHVMNYAWSGQNLYWLHKSPGENWFRVHRYDGHDSVAIGEGDDRPIIDYFTVDGQGSAAWEYSTKQWDYDKRVIYVSPSGGQARRAIQRDVPPNITRVEDVRGAEVMLNSTDLLTSAINYNVSLIRTNGYVDHYIQRKSAPAKARFVEGGVIRHLVPETASALIVTGDQGGEDYVSLDHVIHDRFETDGVIAAGALLKGGVQTYIDGQGVQIPTAAVVNEIKVQDGSVAWFEGADGHVVLKVAFQHVLVRSTGEVKSLAGHLVKSPESPMVYLAAQDGKRYAFANQNLFYGWYPNFHSVQVISPESLAALPLAGNVLYRPDYRLIKSSTSPRVYAVGQAGELHWVQSADILRSIYGYGWQRQIDTVPDSLMVDYRIGDPIVDADRYYMALVN